MYDPLRAKARTLVTTALAAVAGLGVAAGLGWSYGAGPVIDQTPRVSEEAVRPALDLSDAFVNISDAVTPAVVRIEARRAGRAVAARGLDLRQFFPPGLGPRSPEGGTPEPQPELAGGSGFIISEDGFILTNDHVVSGADQIRVYLRDRRYFDARLVGTDPFTDVAVLKIDVAESLPTLSLGDSESVRVGEWVLAVGNPGFGAGSQLDYTVTAGIVSARGRGLQLLQRELQREFGRDPETQNLAGYAIENFIQTDAVINPGNSGGPMVDLQGRVIGINSAIASATGFYQGYGFAIPVNLARRVMEDLVEYGHVRRAMLGVQIADVTPEDAEVYGLPSVSGVLVQSVTEGGPAARAGLHMEDVIVSVDGKGVGFPSALQQEVAQFRPGDRVTVEIYRDRQLREVEVQLGEAPINNLPDPRPERVEMAEERLGFRVEPLDEENAEALGFGAPGGVVITEVERASPAERRQIFPGLKILRINDRAVGTPDDVRGALDGVVGGEVVSLLLESPNGNTRIVNVRMPDR